MSVEEMSAGKPARAGRRGRSGGGASGRRQARSGVKLQSLPYVHRQLEPTDILSQEAVEIIEAKADTLMEEVGIIFSEDEEAYFRPKTKDHHKIKERISAGSKGNVFFIGHG